MADVEARVGRGWFARKWSGFEEELGLGCHD